MLWILMFLLYYWHIDFDVPKVLKMSPHFLILGRTLYKIHVHMVFSAICKFLVQLFHILIHFKLWFPKNLIANDFSIKKMNEQNYL